MKKYPEIENEYRQKFINYFLETFPELKNIDYIIQEKYDGSNISLIFDSNIDSPYKIASRNRILDDGENFNDVFKVIKKYPELIDYGIKTSINFGCKVIFFGEIFGKGIQNRFDYGPEKYIKIFDVYIEDKGFLSQVVLYENDILSKYVVKTFGIINGLENAINFTSDEFKNGEIEGYVIKPYLNVYESGHDMFYLKHKIPEMKEKGKKQKVNKEINFSDEVKSLYELFTSYINKNRVLSIFSKEGEINNPKDIGKYIKLILEDAKKDFIKENEINIENFDKKEQKFIFNTSKQIVKILNEYL